VSDYSAFLLEELRWHYSIDLVHDSGYIPEPALANREFMSCDYRLFNRVAAAKDYHAIIYQMGNSHYHSYMFESLLMHPGLVTLHDFCLPGFHLHYGESRGLGHRFIADELRRSYPEDREAIEGALASWPLDWEFVRECVRRGWHLNRRILNAAQVMVVHSPWCALETEKGTPHHSGKVVVIPHGMHPKHISPAERVAVRERFRLPQDATIYASFGFINAEKMNLQAIEAFAFIAREKAASLFIFAGEEEDGGEARLHAEALGLSSRVRFLGRQPAEAFNALISITDIGVNLRLPPTNGETSGTLLNLLAAGVPTVVTDVATFSDYPDSSVRKVHWETEGREGLLRAMSELSSDPGYRNSLGKAAWNYVAGHHRWDHVSELYVNAIERCHQERLHSLCEGRKSPPLDPDFRDRLQADAADFRQSLPPHDASEG
jgi:glycosyltransferase involved in cell wall biosynthesis